MTSAFNDLHCEWVHYNDGTYVLSAELFPKKEQALAQLHEEFDEGYSMYAKDFTVDDIYEDLVRFSCQGAHDGDGESGCMWYLGATGKGSKPYLQRSSSAFSQTPWEFKPGAAYMYGAGGKMMEMTMAPGSKDHALMMKHAKKVPVNTIFFMEDGQLYSSYGHGISAPAGR